MKPASEPIEVNMQDLEALLERARQGPLGEEDYQKLKAAIHTLGQVAHLLQERETTIRELRRLLLPASTEKTSKVLEQVGLEVSAKKSQPPGESASEKQRPGHGRHGAEAYRGARRIPISHASLKPGDHCPGCWKGKVYAQKEPALRIRLVGQAPLEATVYELQSFRCNLCGEVFEAEAPEEVGEKKYDATSASMIGLLKYGSGVPFYRLAGLEEGLGIPLPASTQWGIIQETAERIRPAMEELIRQAAQGEIVYNDDTRMKILALARASPHPVGAEEGVSNFSERTGQFTSGIVSTRQGQRMALFFTGRRQGGRTSPRCWRSGPPSWLRPSRCATRCRAICRNCRRSSRSSWRIAWLMADAAS